MTSRWSYRRWDGTQTGFEDEIDALFAELSDDLLYHGDPDAALRRLLSSGFERPDGERVQGLREMMERLRQQRQEELNRGELGGAFEEIAQELEQVIAEERAGLEDLADDARNSGDDRRREVTEDVVANDGTPSWAPSPGPGRWTCAGSPRLRPANTSRNSSSASVRKWPRAGSTRCRKR